MKDAIDQKVALTWSQSGPLLRSEAARLQFDPGCAAAVLATECGGRGFGSDGRMILRFENHHFHRHWGKSHPELFARHFQFDSVKPWMRHEWRASESGSFELVHRDQASEWAAFGLASGFDPEAARLSSSLGAPQILGSNYAQAGFTSAGAMFDAFQSGEEAQIRSFFRFLTPAHLEALRGREFQRFAELYNGAANAREYAARLASCYQAFQELPK